MALKWQQGDTPRPRAENPQVGAEVVAECHCIDLEEIYHVQGQRRSPSKIVGGVKQHLETNTIPARDAQRVQTKPCVHQDPETPQRLTRPV